MTKAETSEILYNFLDTVYQLDKQNKNYSNISWQDIYLLQRIDRAEISSVSDLSGHLCNSLSATSRKISHLAYQGFLAKKNSTNDGRVTMVELTPLGQKLLARIEQSLFDGIRRIDNVDNTEALPEDLGTTESIAQLNTPVCILKPIFTASDNLFDLQFIYLNDSFKRCFHNSCMLKKFNLLSNYALPFFKKILSICLKVLSSGNPHTIEFYRESKIQLYRWVCIRSDSGNIISILSETGTYQKRREKRHRIPQYRYRNFFNSGPIKIVLGTNHGRILDVNQAAVHYYGWSREKFCEMTLFQISMNPPKTITTMFDMVKEKGYAILTASHRLANGEIRNVEIHASTGWWGDRPAHFSIVFDRSRTADTDFSKRIDSSDIKSSMKTKSSYLSFISRYKKDMPYIEEMIVKLSDYGKIVNYRRGEHFLEFGTESPNVGFILEGLFRYYTITSDGKECTLGFYRSGQIFHSLAFSRLNTTNSIALEACKESKVFVVARKNLLPMVNNDTRWYKLFYHDLISHLLAKQSRDISLLCEDAASRYRRFLSDEKDAIAYLRSYHIASYLGITSETLSRIRKK